MSDVMRAERVYTPAEVATTLRVSQATISRAIRSGRLKAFRVGGQWRILASEVGRFVEAGRPPSYIDSPTAVTQNPAPD